MAPYERHCAGPGRDARATPAPAARLAYDAPGDCPNRAQFSAAVSARGAELATAGPTGEDRVMVVSINKERDGYGGAFHVRDSRGATGKREVHAQTLIGCSAAPVARRVG